MRKIITTTFVTLDGVMQAPGGPEEDTADGFKYGGWQYGYGDQVQDDFIGGLMSQPFELLLGRKTYDIFAAYWPTAKTDK
jgi:dihydrofolate reductase